jgi:hypothetical protein
MAESMTIHFFRFYWIALCWARTNSFPSSSVRGCSRPEHTEECVPQAVYICRCCPDRPQTTGCICVRFLYGSSWLSATRPAHVECQCCLHKTHFPTRTVEILLRAHAHRRGTAIALRQILLGEWITNTSRNPKVHCRHWSLSWARWNQYTSSHSISLRSILSWW